MLIREARPQDIPNIISVLKASLREVDLPLSAEIWNYKHKINPFGESLILLAEENGTIAGVRAFMRWEWQCGNNKYSAFRAVDTATHPKFQGRGIFKKLTLRAVEKAIEGNDQFVFNTPNEQSKPGYLKMGWKEVGKIRVGLQPAWNSILKIGFKKFSYDVVNKSSKSQIDKLCATWNQDMKKREKIFTPKSYQYLTWRYENNPLQEYEVFSGPNFYLAGYVKKRKNLKELRIAECIFDPDEKDLTLIHRKIKTWSLKFGVQVISFSPGLLPTRNLVYKGYIGPMLTLKSLNFSKKDMAETSKIQNWNYSLGDLELF